MAKSLEPAEPKPTFFADAGAFRRWLEKNHASVGELWVGFYKKATGKPSITWPESVDQALCFGWIDGLRKSIDAESYRIRFTPRRPGSIWSAVNRGRAEELIRLGLMHPAGAEAFLGRDVDRTNLYSFEREHAELNTAQRKQFQANAAAWSFFRAQPPFYRKLATWWVISAKREETRQRRLSTLIADSEAGVRIEPMRSRRPG